VVSPPAGDEAAPQGDPAEYVRSLALVKARQVASNVQRGLVLAADTVVVDGGAVLGKPRDAAEALEMLRRLRGRDHTVLTGVSVVDAVSHDSVAQAQSSTVTMRSYSDAEAEAFVASGAAADKAGAYAIQDPEFSPAEAVDGCFLNVVGLPLCMAVGLLRQMGADLADIPAPSECSNCLLAGPSE
jgi:MAF protein